MYQRGYAEPTELDDASSSLPKVRLIRGARTQSVLSVCKELKLEHRMSVWTRQLIFRVTVKTDFNLILDARRPSKPTPQIRIPLGPWGVFFSWIFFFLSSLVVITPGEPADNWRHCDSCSAATYYVTRTLHTPVRELLSAVPAGSQLQYCTVIVAFPLSLDVVAFVCRITSKSGPTQWRLPRFACSPAGNSNTAPLPSTRSSEDSLPFYRIPLKRNHRPA